MRKIFYEIGTTKKQKEDTTKREMVLFCLSDLHGTCYEPGNRPIIECAWDQKPDLILASGDMLSGDREEGDAIAVALLSRLSDLAPVCFVNGNHEMCVERHQPERYQKFMDDLKNGGVQVLHNETAWFWIDGEKVAVTGYELPWEYYRRFSRRHPSVVGMERSIGKRKQDAYQILLTHNPVFFEEYAAWGADFTFAGHLHGGFIRLPYFGGVISPQFQLFPKYDHGLYQMDTSSMVVGAGMGNHSGLFRINNPTEIVTGRIKRRNYGDCSKITGF